ncbi:TlyA family RNA methyltransferase [Salibacterium halotolerans]|uniref:23S rRNA (Cytidine1920-2'-O)/16S rRNA (Cytidine1409-2'-O)-methyltransferase n=1 Tax=Salibacterium halotolerans TaxID=1884432 RepID=A0A1I5NPI4_9BACI|nr:TlyA family RNA methyltransferase [Salibacterium halotolerans]SFP23725.1 23S rRNA (cytidine1920-2'-O)/16S rRNA (cytidine1409-2'-O)-methyltransferase [Salibacterium halotolerans]
MNKERIDTLLVEQGFLDSREQAKRAVMAGIVLADDEPVDKPGTKISRTAELRLKGTAQPYVSRGGLKLEKALDVFQIEMEGTVFLDIGASTGGFTDCALQRGASSVYAVDSGTNQLVWKLRSNEKVTTLERYNFRYADPSDFKPRPNRAAADVSFISLKLLLTPLSSVLAEDSRVTLLVKPQFEAGREQVGKKGIVRDPEVHERILYDITEFAETTGFHPVSLDYSPITGGDGNIEYLLYLEWKPTCLPDSHAGRDIERVVKQAHAGFARLK